jgi:hypothetical protein
MKKYIPLILFLFANSSDLCAQSNDDYSAIKLFIDQNHINDVNSELNNAALCQRLYTKTMQLINQTGVAEVGYSTFLVTPKMDVLSTSVDQSGISSIYLAECELSITVGRIGLDNGNSGGATYASFSKKITGSGSTKDAAISNAVNTISSNDQKILEFIKQAKVKIDNYYKTNCNEVLKEAEQASKLQMYSKSIALYFSIPSSAGACYETARAASVGVYRSYLDSKCDSQLIKLKAVVALAITDNGGSSSHYTEALNIIGRMDPTSSKCYKEAQIQIEKIEKRFDEQQKREWQLETKRISNTAELQKEMVKAMGKINSSYQPSGSTVIIAK